MAGTIRACTRVRDDVASATQDRQRPAVNGRLRDDERFFFLPPP